jgi:uncharacterized repeat protein (TIGR01451 family)
MKKVCFGAFLALVAVAAVFGAGRLMPGGPERASADIVAGQYSLGLSAPAAAHVGGTFVVTVDILHQEQPADCSGSPTPFGCYQAVQWKIDYNQPQVTYVSAVRHTGAPTVCASISDNTDTTLLGCLDSTGPNMIYSGIAYDVTYQCAATPGVGTLDLVESTGPTAKTFVKVSTTAQPIHIHNVVVPCILMADVVASKTPPTQAVDANGTLSWTVTGTNTGPDPWTGAGVVDNLPDTMSFVSCTVDVDADGIGGSEIVGAPCVPGWAPTFPNPFYPPDLPATLNNLVISAADLPPLNVHSIAVGGSMTMHITATAGADACSQTLVDMGIAISSDLMGGIEVMDPDFLDGVDPTDDNFANAIAQVTNCPITVVKAKAPAGDTVSNSVETYNLTVTNTGLSQAMNTIIVDNLNALGSIGTHGVTLVGSLPAGCVEAPAGVITCNLDTLTAAQVKTIAFTVNVGAPGVVCNKATSTWTRLTGIAPNDPPLVEDTRVATGSGASNEVCYTVKPLFNGLVKSVAGTRPGEGQTTFPNNLWLCIDQANDGIDNNGDSVVDNENHTCTGAGEGALTIQELVATSRDCDSPNDDDDHDGKPVSNSPTLANGAPDPAFRPECPQPTTDDYVNGLVDKNGGEVPEGLGALEFQLKFDHKLFNISIVNSTAWTNGRSLNCTMTILTENDIRYGCVTTGSGVGLAQGSGEVAATINLTPVSDLIYRIRPTKDNGVTARLLDENCEIADTLGDVFPNTLAGGLTQDCSDLDVTIRRLEGDVDTSCKVDVVDAQRMAWRYGSFFGHLSYDQNYDLQPWPTGDFDIDIKDLQFVFGRIGSTCAAPIPLQPPVLATGINEP